jgi:hypothetical protein
VNLKVNARHRRVARQLIQEACQGSSARVDVLSPIVVETESLVIATVGLDIFPHNLILTGRPARLN